MKRILCMLLASCLLVAAFGMIASADDSASANVKKEFIVDGNLDVWYLEQEFDYYFGYLDPYAKSDGKSPYDPYLVETDARVWTAYDDEYVYFYIKVWDEELFAYKDPDANIDGNDSSAGDSIEIWFDPDPESQGRFHPNTDDDPNAHYWCNNTNNTNQGDVRVRLQGANFAFDDYHNVVGKVGYPADEPLTNWFKNTENFCPFKFSGELNEVVGISSGYGVEARFPRNDDGANSYRFNIAVNNSAEFQNERYTLALGAAWWISYSAGVPVNYETVNPFFEQDVTDKKVIYTDSIGNALGQGIVDRIDAMSNPDKAAVESIYNEFLALNVVQKGFVVEHNFAALQAAGQAVGITIPDPVLNDYGTGGGQTPPVPNPPTPAVRGDINGDEVVNAVDALDVLKFAVGKGELTAEQQVMADLNEDKDINAADALVILKIAVGK